MVVVPGSPEVIVCAISSWECLLYIHRKAWPANGVLDPLFTCVSPPSDLYVFLFKSSVSDLILLIKTMRSTFWVAG